MKKLNLVVLASGGGTNLQAIIDHIEAGKLSAQIKAVISNNSKAGALERARNHNIPAIHLSHKHSSIMESALLGKEAAQDTGCHIEVIDSRGVTMWQALVTIAAARSAGTGYGLHQVVERVHDAISRARGLGLLGTMRYAVKGGRLGNAIFRVESLLDVKSLLTVHDGELRPAGLVRTWEKGVERLHEFIRAKPDIESVAIAHSALPNDARKLADYVTSLFPNLIPKIAQLGPILVTHTGPGTMMIATI